MRSTGSIDLSPDDLAARENLVQDVIDLRMAKGLSRTEVSRLRGLAESQFDFERRSNWRYMTAASAVRALGRTFHMNLVGLIEPEETTESIILDSVTGKTPGDLDFINLMKLRNKMVRIRFELGITIKSISIHETEAKTISRWERSDKDTWVSNLQRYARRLGGHIVFDISEPV